MTALQVETNPPDFDDFAGLHALLSAAFAYMDGRIDPPSSMARLDIAGLRAKAATEDLMIIRDPGQLLGCLFGAVEGEDYYIGKLAVDARHRQGGLGRALITAAEHQAGRRGCRALTLQTRVELVENHATFARLGFVQSGASAHPGYARPTSLSFRKTLSSALSPAGLLP